ncbi:MAG: cytochrome c-type biogenesis protein CcmH [Gemmatimonadales bacterium]
MDRRTFLKRGMVVTGLGLAVTGGLRAQQQGDSLAGRGAEGTLRDPYSAGKPRAPVTEGDNLEAVKLIEQKLKCSCGCNLDIFTCRTTDFTCETSPRLHRQVLGLHQAGFTEEQIIQQFVAEYGEQTLMAPKPEGFNLAGYLVPGSAILIAGAMLTAYLVRRRKVALAGAAVPGEPAPEAHASVEATPEELERLQREMVETDEDY